MSKELNTRLIALREKLKATEDKKDHANIDLVFDIAGDVLGHVTTISGSLKRIADSLEKRATVAPMGEGLVVGELAKFEPAIDPALVQRLVKAVEKLASAPPPS